MIRRLLVCGLLLILPVSLSAQGVILPEGPLDPAHATVRDGYMVLRDSLSAVMASVARLERDLSHSSPYVLASRASRLQERCSAALRTLPLTRKAFLESPLMDSVPMPQRKQLGGSLRNLETSLAGCDSQFMAWSDRSKTEELRGYGVATGLKTADAIHAYDASANDVLRLIHIRLRPLGAGPSPLAGSVEQMQPSRAAQADSTRH